LKVKIPLTPVALACADIKLKDPELVLLLLPDSNSNEEPALVIMLLPPFKTTSPPREPPLPPEIMIEPPEVPSVLSRKWNHHLLQNCCAHHTKLMAPSGSLDDAGPAESMKEPPALSSEEPLMSQPLLNPCPVVFDILPAPPLMELPM
jgi:hypothetical protein